ncbi:MAG: 30S ribosomal protein S6, partial [Ruminococcaceae bacterium]|nr:30S ribosomal protein S6 [Oscillospiraceae bacterium]
MIHNYETVMVIDAALTEEEIKATIAKFTDLISANGTLESVDEWGKRRLAYPIDYKTEGYYVLINFSSGVEFPAELERIYNITSGILRSLVV